MAGSGPLLTEAHWKENRALPPETTQAAPRWPSVNQEPSCPGRFSEAVLAWRTFLSQSNERQQLKWSESFLNGSFGPAKKRVTESEKPSGATGRGWMSKARIFLWETATGLNALAEFYMD